MHITGERKCIACRNHFLKQDLIRISRGENGILVGDSKKVNGRAIYVCKNNDCIELVCKKKLLNKALSCAVEQSVYDNLRGYIE